MQTVGCMKILLQTDEDLFRSVSMTTLTKLGWNKVTYLFEIESHDGLILERNFTNAFAFAGARIETGLRNCCLKIVFKFRSVHKINFEFRSTTSFLATNISPELYERRTKIWEEGVIIWKKSRSVSSTNKR